MSHKLGCMVGEVWFAVMNTALARGGISGFEVRVHWCVHMPALDTGFGTNWLFASFFITQNGACKIIMSIFENNLLYTSCPHDHPIICVLGTAEFPGWAMVYEWAAGNVWAPSRNTVPFPLAPNSHHVMKHTHMCHHCCLCRLSVSGLEWEWSVWASAPLLTTSSEQMTPVSLSTWKGVFALVLARVTDSTCEMMGQFTE